MSDPKLYQRIQTLSAEMIAQSRANLYLQLRFLGNTIFYLEPANHPKVSSFSTDGTHYYYNSFYILKCFQNSSGRIARDYMHSLLHCVFRHFLTTPAMDRELWDLACDIAAENLIESFVSPLFSCPEISEQERPYLADFSQAVSAMSAEKLYTFLADSGMGLHDTEVLRTIFSRDDHGIWYASEGMQSSDFSQNTAAKNISVDSNAASEKWELLAKEISLALQDETAQNLSTFRKAFRLEPYDSVDYSAFLKRFASPRETLTTDQDSFDYILYTYGLSVYQNLPLIEPLEYKATPLIRNFVIAIDTSGSIPDHLVASFLKTTCSLLQSTASLCSEISICILQCDAQIQDAVHLTSVAEIRDYMEHLTIKGRGETDFRPVFEYVDRQIASGTFSDVSGLLYLTDGDGLYPDHAPSYETAFLLPAETAPAPGTIPSWIIRVLLTEHDLCCET